jgi:hypothetical protein
MTSDEVNLWRLLSALVFIMALSALVVGSLAYTRSNNVNNPNQIFLGSTSLTDFAATQTVKTRNILGSTLAPAAITTAGTLFNGDVNVNSVSFTGQGLTLYSDTLGLYYLLEGSDTQHVLGTTDFTTLALSGIVTSVGTVTTIPDGNITNAMLANASLSNLSGTAGATTNTGTFHVTGATTLSTTLAVTAGASMAGLTVTGGANVGGLQVNGAANVATLLSVTSLHVDTTTTLLGDTTLGAGCFLSRTITLANQYAGTGQLSNGVSNIVISGLTSKSRIMVTRKGNVPPILLGSLGWLTTMFITPGSPGSFEVHSLTSTGALQATDESTFDYVVFFEL